MRVDVVRWGIFLFFGACRSSAPAPDAGPAAPLPSAPPLPSSSSPASLPNTAFDPFAEHDRWGALAESPDGILALPCSSELEPAKADAGALPQIQERPSVSALVQAGRDGKPVRVRLRFHNPLMPCPCPDFEVLTRDEDGALSGSSSAYLVFSRSVVDGNRFSWSRHAGNTNYLMVGYFSGRMIDHYEWTRRQTGHEEPRKASDEEVHEWRSRYPEFCVASWCAILDGDPVGAGNPWRFEAKDYGKYVAAMRKAGVLFCTEDGGMIDKRPPRATGATR